MTESIDFHELDLTTAIKAASATVQTLSLAAYLQQQPGISIQQGYADIINNPNLLAIVTTPPPTNLIRQALEYIIVRDNVRPLDDAGIWADRLLENVEHSATILVKYGINAKVSTGAGFLPLSGLLALGVMVANGELEPAALSDPTRMQPIVAALQKESFNW